MKYFLAFFLLLSSVSPLNSFAAVETPQINASSLFSLTNAARQENGKSSFVWDDRLASIAEKKLNDMFTRGYFDHQDPDGNTAGARAIAAGYDYTLFGENLAMGWFDNDHALIDAWMKSAGHRKNILFNDFTSIGIAVDERSFDGEQTLIAIQLFARPTKICPRPSSDLAAAIVLRQTYRDKLETIMDAYRAEKGIVSSRRFQVLTNQVSAVMTVFLRELNEKIDAYNAQIDAYETCIDAG
jgi:hypothetical protein